MRLRPSSTSDSLLLLLLLLLLCKTCAQAHFGLCGLGSDVILFLTDSLKRPEEATNKRRRAGHGVGWD
jgi:hypothetical protein